MKKRDYLVLFLSVLAVFLIVFPVTSKAFFSFTDRYAIFGGFIKFFLFATFGDILSHRIKYRNYRVPGLLYKAFIWGFIGISVVFVFQIFTVGIDHLQTIGLLPFAGSVFASAVFTSIFMNVTFGPTMMLFHRVTDHYIEHKVDDRKHRLTETIQTLDYRGFLRFVVFKTIPLFWIPAHTITFMLDDTYRVFFASLLGVALGLLLGIAKPTIKQEG